MPGGAPNNDEELPPSPEEIEKDRQWVKKVLEREKKEKREGADARRDSRIQQMQESKNAIEQSIALKSFQMEVKKGRVKRPETLPEEKGKSIEPSVALKAFQVQKRKERDRVPKQLSEDQGKPIEKTIAMKAFQAEKRKSQTTRPKELTEDRKRDVAEKVKKVLEKSIEE